MISHVRGTTRRSVLKLGSALGAAALMPKQSAWAQPMLVRPDISSAAGNRMAGLYAQAVAKMKDPAINYPPQPQSWTFQAYIHGVPADPFQPVESPPLFLGGTPDLAVRIDQLYGQPASGTPKADWKAAALRCWATCPHGSPLFVVWHRWYLHYFERIVRSLSGASDFVLPYWNYASDAGASLQLPPAFQNPLTPDNSALNVLYEDLRGLGFFNPAGTGVQDLPMNEGGYLPFPQTDYGPALLAKTLFPSDLGNRPFFPPDPGYYSYGLSGRLETQPHDFVHVNVGGLMQNVPVAAADPVFFVHHCQIDRLWASWQSRAKPADYNWGSTGLGGNDPSESDWKGSKFVFVDENKKLVEVPAGNALNTTDLGYTYDALAPVPTPQVAAAAPAAPTPKLALTPMETKGVTVGSTGAHFTLSPVPGAAPPSAAAVPPAATLVLKDVRLLLRPPAPLHVFLNLPEGTAPDLTSPFHVGTLNFFNWASGTGGPMPHMVRPGSAVAHMMASTGEFRFSVGDVLTQQKAQNLWNGGPITVTITTLGADKSKGRTYVTIGQVQLVP